MHFSSEASQDGGLKITVDLSKEDIEKLKSAVSTNILWGKTDYCVTCHDNFGKEYTYTIECYGDIAANIEAAATCMKEVGSPSYALRKGHC